MLEKHSTLLRPTTEDYAAVFESDFAKKAEETYKEPWEKGQFILKVKFMWSPSLPTISRPKTKRVKYCQEVGSRLHST